MVEFDFEKLFKYLAVENSLLIVGIFSFLISIYNEYLLGMKLGFLFLLFGAIIRFYRINFVQGIFYNYMDRYRYKRKTLYFDEKKGKTSEIEQYVIPFSGSWHMNLVDFVMLSIILLIFIYAFIEII